MRHVTAALVLLIFASNVHAQATRTWVSGVGDDANPCSRTAPCKTFAGAISKTAAGGEISALDPGGYGVLTITKSITIDGAGTLASILASITNGININIGANDRVYLRNLSINGGSSGLAGIRVLTPGRVHIENVTIFNFNSSGNSRGVIVTNSSGVADVTIANSTIRHIAGMGIESRPSGTGTVRLTMNEVLVSDVGQSAIDLDNNTQALLVRSTLTNNAVAGLYVERSSAVANVYDSVISQNAWGVYVGDFGGGTVRLCATQIWNNTTNGISIFAGTVASHQNNAIFGNAGTQATNLNVGAQ